MIAPEGKLANGMKLPHSEEAIAAQIKVCDAAEETARAQKATLAKMYSENAAAEHEEKVRKARKMTPTMRAVLERLAAGEEIVRLNYSWGSRPTRYCWRGPHEKIPQSLLHRLCLAGYFAWAPMTITDLGRKALEESK